MEGGAPKQQRPAFCATLPPLPGQAAPKFTCGHATPGVRRLCPCQPVPGAQQAGLADGGGGGGGGAEQQQMGAAREGGLAAEQPQGTAR